MKTFSAKAHTVHRDWYLIDATDRTLGRLASEIARRLRGKHKPQFTPHVDTGDYIVVVNAEKIRVTGKKLTDKIYHRHTGYIGNLKSVPLEKLLARAPERAIQYAVKGMLPKNALGRQMYRKLHVYAGPKHAHAAQQPKSLKV
ncbi:MAG: 50S ribosomal protein L13, partial [Gammaproteobacteria bacterium]|nr:50S ribosomal protein L13 [Gammaproteobacteria bacterium]